MVATLRLAIIRQVDVGDPRMPCEQTSGREFDGVYLYIMQRTQIYLSEEHLRQLKELAKRRGVTSSSVIRDALDSYLARQVDPQDRLRKLKDLAVHLSSTATGDNRDSAAEVEELRRLGAERLNSLRDG